MTATPKTRAQLFERLQELGIKSTTHEHRAVFTVAESESLEGELPGAHTKNLFLKDAKGCVYLVVVKSASRIDLKALPKSLECARLSFGKPELLMQLLGVPPGSVTAFSLINDPDQRVRVVVDAALMDHATINCHPLENTATTNIGREDLLAFIRACGHEPLILELPVLVG